MKTTRRGKATVMTLKTEDMTDPPKVKAAFEEIIELKPKASIVVDMAEVTALTSMGVAAISSGAALIAKNGAGRFALVGVSGEVKKVIDVVAPALQIELGESMESVLNSLNEDEDDHAA